MKRLYMTTVLALVLTLCSFAEVADLCLENERVENNVFKFEIALQRTDAWASDGLGHADFYFSFNDDALAHSPRTTNLHPAIDGNTSYAVSAHIHGGLLHVKIDFSNGGGLPWLPALNLAEQICTVEMDILDGTQNSRVEWDVFNTGILTSDTTPVQETFLGTGDISLPVELSFFQAKFANSVVEITWRTESEFNNWGFHLYRSTDENGLNERINPSLIKGAGYSSMATDYKFVDERIEENTTYFYKLEDVDMNGNTRQYAPVRVQTGSTPVVLVDAYALEQNYPNPFNPETTISFQLENSEHILLTIYNIDGRLVRVLADGHFQAGRHAVVWDGLNEAGWPAPSGSYLYQFKTPGFQQSKNLTLVR